MKQQRKWAIILIQVAAIFGVIGVIIGSSMSGEGNYSLRPIHAHVTLVGWLSMFAWGIFYYSVPIKKLILVKVHAVFAVIGAIGLTSGMYLYNLDQDVTWAMVFFIVGGTILLLAFVLFLVNTLFIDKEK